MKKNQILVKDFAIVSANNPVSETTNGIEMYNVSGPVTFVRYAIGRMNKKVKEGKLDEVHPDFQKAWDAGLKYFYNIPDPCPIKGEGRLPEAIDVVSGKTAHFKTEAAVKATFVKIFNALPEDWQEVCAEHVNAAKKAFGFEAPAKSTKKPAAKKTKPAKSLTKVQTDAIVLMTEKLLTLEAANWSELDAAVIKKINANCEKIGIKATEVRKEYESLIEPEETDELDLDF